MSKDTGPNGLFSLMLLLKDLDDLKDSLLIWTFQTLVNSCLKRLSTN